MVDPEQLVVPDMRQWSKDNILRIGSSSNLRGYFGVNVSPQLYFWLHLS